MAAKVKDIAAPTIFPDSALPIVVHFSVVAEYIRLHSQLCDTKNLLTPAIFSKKSYDICIRIQRRFEAIYDAQHFCDLAEMYRIAAINSAGEELVQW